MRKLLSVVLILALAASNLIIVESATAQSIPKPSIPEFTVKLIDNSYNVPATYSTDPYTGEKRLVEPAHRTNNGSIQLWITNQKYTYSNGSTFHIYYLVRTKGHYEDTWYFTYPSLNRRLISSESNEDAVFIDSQPLQSDSKYTVLSLGVHSPNPADSARVYPSGAKVDIQVQAIVGHDSQYFQPDKVSSWTFHPPYTGYYADAIAYDVSSDWSNTQTIAISWSDSSPQAPTPMPSQLTSNPTATAFPTQNPSETPLQPDVQIGFMFAFDWWQISTIALAVVVVVLLVVVGVLFRKRRVA